MDRPPIVFTEEQRSAIEATFARFTVTASAGAGKTSVLTARYLRHICEEGLTPDQILTITFTRKAAAEMKRRIVDQLIAVGLPDQAQIAESGPIQTIQSFCGRLLRENATDAGVDPRFEELTGRLQSQIMRSAMHYVLSQDYSDDPDVNDFIRKIAGQSKGWATGSPYGKIEDSIETVVAKLRTADVQRAEVRANYENPEALRFFWERLVMREMPREVRERFDEISAETFDQRVQLAYRAAKAIKPKWVTQAADPQKEAECRHDVCVLVRLACDTWARFDAECEQRQQFDYAAIERRALAVVRESPSAADRVRRQYRVLMVDEAQDVNPVQYALFDALGIERLMVVGDAKQSIYGFRNADVRLFEARMQEDQVRLTKNHRTEEAGILRFVDLVFGRLWGPSYPPMAEPVEFDLETVSEADYHGVEFWQGGDIVVQGIQELIADGVAPGEICALFRSGKAMEAVRDALAGKGILARISGATEKFFTRLEVRDLANALRAVSDPYDDYSLLATLHGPFGGVSLDAMVLLAQQKPVVEALEAFVSPIAEDAERLATFRGWFDRIRADADRFAAWEVIAQLFAETPYLEVLARHPHGDRQIANARKLLMMATQEPLVGPMAYAELIRETQNLGHREGDAPFGSDQNRVTLSTIHSSKGLEFPVVIVAETDRKVEGWADSVIVDSRQGLVAANFQRYQDAAYRYLNGRRKERNIEEEQRVLYVAMTRARRRLCLVVQPPSDKSTFSNWITGRTRGALPGVVTRGG